MISSYAETSISGDLFADVSGMIPSMPALIELSPIAQVEQALFWSSY